MLQPCNFKPSFKRDRSRYIRNFANLPSKRYGSVMAEKFLEAAKARKAKAVGATMDSLPTLEIPNEDDRLMRTVYGFWGLFAQCFQSCLSLIFYDCFIDFFVVNRTGSSKTLDLGVAAEDYGAPPISSAGS